MKGWNSCSITHSYHHTKVRALLEKTVTFSVWTQNSPSPPSAPQFPFFLEGCQSWLRHWESGEASRTPAQHTRLKHEAQQSETRYLQARALLWSSTLTWRGRGFIPTSWCLPCPKTTIIHRTTWSCLWSDHCNLFESPFFPASLLISRCIISKAWARWSRGTTSDSANPLERRATSPCHRSQPGSEAQPVKRVCQSPKRCDRNGHLKTGCVFERRPTLSHVKFSSRLLMWTCILLLFGYKRLSGLTPWVQWQQWQKR